MSIHPLLSRPSAPEPSPGRSVRVEYLEFQDVDQYREFRFRVYGPDGSSEFRMRIANAAFDARQVRMQDGPDLCYQKLMRVIADGVTAQPDVITIDDGDLFSYRDEHTLVPKRRSWAPSSPVTPVVEPRKQPQYRARTPRTVSPRLPVAPLVTKAPEPAFEEGQRVNHAVFGMGVTTATASARTVVNFDRVGPKSFVTSMLELEVLSAPHTWETSPRGVNRPDNALGRVTGSPS
jgi:hypothetical protein